MSASSPTVARQWIYTTRPGTETVSSDHYELKETTLPAVGAGEVLLKSLFISVDPYMRIQQAASDTWEEPHPLDTVQEAGVVAEVVESQSPLLAVGDIVNAGYGWSTHGVVKADSVRKLNPGLAPVSTALGVLGMPGRTAYFGFIEAGKPEKGETVVVSGAAGAVGSNVVQIAKILGCRVVGIAGAPEKLERLTNEYGCDAVINYKDYPTRETMESALKETCPSGIDIYFDNVGGHITDAVIPLINVRARVIVCGQISQYNGNLDDPQMCPRFLHHFLYKRATLQGILSRDYSHRMEEMVGQMGSWIKEGKLKYRETVVEGFDQLPSALNSLFQKGGKSTGKVVVKI
eukprot:TRINITY_DN244_c0_g1_i1.p1 TRINITY_DN244_c0_g1~~TRINITY_DN244_c0_g1_i1.p1  ORF type:complete len:354 (+),score=71.19 TRINITY_DN244_c0_g1_i1:23-1063(+)